MTASLFELFQRGGPIMWPILFCSVTALAIALERLLFLARTEEESEPFLNQIGEALQGRQPAQAQRLCDGLAHHPLARIASQGLRARGRPRKEILERLEETVSVEAGTLERHLPILGMIAHLAPLLGLLGTVTGLVRCFQVIQEKATSIQPVNPGELAGGIWEALLTTIFGLGLAIPAYALYHYLAYRVNHLTRLLEASSLKLADLLSGEPLDANPSRP